MTPYRHTRIKQITDCLRTCWNDVYLLCRDWSTQAEHLSESERLLVDQTYIDLDLNRNARRLYDLASAPDLLAEVSQGEYSIEIMALALVEIERIDGCIDNWFARVESSDDGPVNAFLSHDIYLIRDAMFNVQFIFEPLVRVQQKQVNPVNVDPSDLATKQKPKRVNTEAKDRHKRVIDRYMKYINEERHTSKTAIQALIHDFRHEYSRGSSENRKKQIQRIIREWNNQNNKEQ